MKCFPHFYHIPVLERYSFITTKFSFDDILTGFHCIYKRKKQNIVGLYCNYPMRWTPEEKVSNYEG